MVKFSMYVLTKIYTFLSFKIKYYVVRKVSFFRKRVFYNSATKQVTNVKPSLWNVAVFISTKQNGSYVIRQNNIKQETLCVY